MTTRKARTRRAQPRISSYQPETRLPSPARAAEQSTRLLRHNAEASPRIRDTSRKVNEQLAEELGYTIKANYANHLAQTLAQNDLHRFSSFVDVASNLLEEERSAWGQAQFEEFCNGTTTGFANAQHSVRFAHDNALGDVVYTSVAADDGVGNEEVIVEVHPGWFDKLTGRTVVKRVKG